MGSHGSKFLSVTNEAQKILASCPHSLLPSPLFFFNVKQVAKSTAKREGSG